MKKTLSLLTLTVLSMPAVAGNFYVGGGLGSSTIEDLCASSPSGFYRDHCDETGGYLHVIGGLRLNTYAAVEASIGFATGFHTFGLSSQNGYYITGYREPDVSSIQAKLLGFLPINSKVSLYGGVSINQTGVSNDNNYDDSHYDIVPGYTGGMEINLTRRVRMRIQYDRMTDFNDETFLTQNRNLNTLSVDIIALVGSLQ